eukprot:15358419-Ditylum_brightwellii.AAC.1
MPWDNDISYGHDDKDNYYDLNDYNNGEEATNLLDTILDDDNCIAPNNVCSALPFLLNSQAGVSLLNAPHQDPFNCLPPHHFCIALCRRLRLPLHCKQRPC